MRGIAIRVGIIAVIALGAFILRPFLSGNAGDLKVGDCFDAPATTADTVKDVQHHPCTDEHGAEVIFVGDYPGSKSDPYPTDDQMSAFLSGKCLPLYKAYTGKDIDATTFDIGWLQPTKDGWTGGDQSVICYIYRLDDTKFKGSLKAS
ncbi:MAG: septum formation family protein [Candidatus Limnocylindrales bacterium]